MPGFLSDRDLRRKILVVVGLVALYRVGVAVPAPGVSYDAVRACETASGSSALAGLVDMLSGGALLQLSVLSLGVIPYLTASIIVQLLGAVVPRLEQLRREGQSGQARVTQYTRYVTVGLAALQGIGLATLASSPGTLFPGCTASLLATDTIAAKALIVLAVTAGAMLVMWMGETITSRGIGNGVSMLIMVSILASMPGQMLAVLSSSGSLKTVVVAVIGVAVVAAVVFMELGQRRIPVQYSNGATVHSAARPAARSYLPLKVNMAGVVPVIFASSLLYLPVLIVSVSGSTSGWARWVSAHLSTGADPIYLSIYVLLIVFFTFFYTAITFNPVDTADDLARAGGFIPGYRPGLPTAMYLDYVLTRLGVPGSLYLAAVAIVPTLVLASPGSGMGALFGGTSLLIVVGVSLDTVKAARAQRAQSSYTALLT